MNKFGHIGIYINDLEKSKEFYTKIMECEIIKEYTYPESVIIFLDAGGTIIELIYKESNKERIINGPIDHMAFKVDSLDEKIKMLKNNNIELSGSPKIVGTARIAFFNGPNNERFEFVEKYNG